VTWLGNKNGLRFGRHGPVLSFGAFKTSSSQRETSCSVELWLQPARGYDSNTLLAFYSRENQIQFSLRPFEGNLRLRSGSRDKDVNAGAYVGDVFRNRKLVFIAITAARQDAAVYVNGTLSRTSAPFRLSPDDLTGELVLGTSPVVNDGWSGELLGLAIYKQELTAAQVSRHFETWTAKGRPDLSQNERVLALYLFDEHRGRVVHDHGGSGIDLYIPERYLILHEKFLEPPWKEFYTGWSYWQNVGINIGGFIPLGFFFCAYLTSERQISRPAVVTVILGAAVSLTIEVLQAYLPTRDSGMTDIITNTLGTGVGVVLYRWKAALLNKTLNRIRFIVFP
jgi:hypothetical protein